MHSLRDNLFIFLTNKIEMINFGILKNQPTRPKLLKASNEKNLRDSNAQINTRHTKCMQKTLMVGLM